MSGALANSSSTLIEQREINLDGHPSRELRGTNASGLPMRMRIYLVGRRLFQLTVSGLNRPDAEAHASKYLDSLRLRQELLLEIKPQ